MNSKPCPGARNNSSPRARGQDRFAKEPRAFPDCDLCDLAQCIPLGNPLVLFWTEIYRRYTGFPELSMRGDICHFSSTNAEIVVRSSRYSRSDETLHPSPNARHAARRTLSACCPRFREQAVAEVAGRLLFPDLGELDYSEAGSFEAFGIIPLFLWLYRTIVERRRPRFWHR